MTLSNFKYTQCITQVTDWRTIWQLTKAGNNNLCNWWLLVFWLTFLCNRVYWHLLFTIFNRTFYPLRHGNLLWYFDSSLNIFLFTITSLTDNRKTKTLITAMPTNDNKIIKNVIIKQLMYRYNINLSQYTETRRSRKHYNFIFNSAYISQGAGDCWLASMLISPQTHVLPLTF